jgi:low affinity Fe/Cu permease
MERSFSKLATLVSQASGHAYTFVAAFLMLIAWGVTGPVFHFSETWQLIANTGTGLITFLMVFLIQNSQNRDDGAMQAKLDELLRAIENAREQFIGIEHLTDLQIGLIRAALEKQAATAPGKQKTAEDSVDRLLRRVRE